MGMVREEVKTTAEMLIELVGGRAMGEPYDSRFARAIAAVLDQRLAELEQRIMAKVKT